MQPTQRVLADANVKLSSVILNDDAYPKPKRRPPWYTMKLAVQASAVMYTNRNTGHL